MDVGKIHQRVVAFAAAAVLAAGAGFMAPNVAMADDTSATSASNIEQALKYIDQINKDVRGVQRTALTEQQIADANGWDSASYVQAGTGTGDILEPFKVNSDLMKWAQTRADELAAQGTITHDNTYNGAPSWAYFIDASSGKKKTNLLTNPTYQMGTYPNGPDPLSN